MATSTDVGIDSKELKSHFPLLAQFHRELAYLDSAATSQKPQVVLDALDDFYETTNANVARGVYALAEHATTAMEQARAKVAQFIGSPTPEQVIFTKNATESLNLVAHSWGRTNLSAGDVVAISAMEHHANIVPWQILAQERGISIRWIDITPDGHIDLTSYRSAIEGASLVALTAMSNVLGTFNEVDQLIALAHNAGAVVSLDACQYVPHHAMDVAAIDADFVSFSGHKMCGPTGVGVLWGRSELLESMPPFLGGGGMINNVTRDGFTCAPLPHKFEAGTPPIAEIVGLGAAIDFLSAIGMDRIAGHERHLSTYALNAFESEFGDQLTVYGPKLASERGGVFSFSITEVHPHDLSQILNERGVCVRAGHHCAKPLMKDLGVGATARASVYLYNDSDDIDRLISALKEAQRFFTF